MNYKVNNLIFDRYTGPQDNSNTDNRINYTNELDKCKVDTISDMDGKKVCLLNINNNPKVLCPFLEI